DRNVVLACSHLKAAGLAVGRPSLVVDLGEQELAPLYECQERVASAARPDEGVRAPHHRLQVTSADWADIINAWPAAGDQAERPSAAVIGPERVARAQEVGHALGAGEVRDIEQP